MLDKHAPVRSKRVKRDTQPELLNDDIKTAMKQRDKFQSRKDWIALQVNYIASHFWKETFSRSVEETKDNIFLWRHIKSLSGRSDLDDRKISDEIVI